LQGIQNGFEVTGSTPDFFQRVRQSLLRRAISCIEAEGGQCEHFLYSSWCRLLWNRA